MEFLPPNPETKVRTILIGHLAGERRTETACSDDRNLSNTSVRSIDEQVSRLQTEVNEAAQLRQFECPALMGRTVGRNLRAFTNGARTKRPGAAVPLSPSTLATVASVSDIEANKPRQKFLNHY